MSQITRSGWRFLKIESDSIDTSSNVFVLCDNIYIKCG